MKKLSAMVLISFVLSVAAFAAAPEVMNYYADSMAKMHEAMMKVRPVGDADIDFVRNMIPHHQGAIDMAQIELKNGKDAELRKMAEDVVDAQTREIKTMNAWLAAHDQTK